MLYGEGLKKKRKEGMTYQAIADVDGTVSHEMVRSVVNKMTTETPSTVTGRDGKQYPTTKPRKSKTVFISTETAEKAQAEIDASEEIE